MTATDKRMGGKRNRKIQNGIEPPILILSLRSAIEKYGS